VKTEEKDLRERRMWEASYIEVRTEDGYVDKGLG